MNVLWHISVCVCVCEFVFNYGILVKFTNNDMSYRKKDKACKNKPQFFFNGTTGQNIL